MVSFRDFTPDGSGMPIYLQIILYMKRGIAAGVITDGEEVPSRRVLSALLGINPNTAQKAYRQLEAEGLILSHAGAKSYVSITPESMVQVREELLLSELRSVISSLKQMGLSLPEAQAYITAHWNEANTDGRITPSDLPEHGGMS